MGGGARAGKAVYYHNGLVGAPFQCIATMVVMHAGRSEILNRYRQCSATNNRGGQNQEKAQDLSNRAITGEETEQVKTRQDTSRHVKTRQDTSRQDETQDNVKQDDKTRHDTT